MLWLPRIGIFTVLVLLEVASTSDLEWSVRHGTAKERFRLLGSLTLHHEDLRCEESSTNQQHCRLELSNADRSVKSVADKARRGKRSDLHNVSLEYTRVSLLPVNQRGPEMVAGAREPSSGLSTQQNDAAPVELQCYVGRYRYRLTDAYHTSVSMHKLAHQALIDLHRKKNAADAHLLEQRANDGVLPHGNVLANFHVHHRLKHILKRKAEVKQAAEEAAIDDADQQNPPNGDANLTERSGGDQLSSDALQRQEAAVFEAIELDENRSLSHQLESEEGRKPLFHHDTPLLGKKLCLSAAAGGGRSIPTADWIHSEHMKGPYGLSQETIGCLEIATATSAEHVPSKTAMPNLFAIVGDLVVAKYLRTNNWKYCRNIQHGMYFNATARNGDEDSPIPYLEHRCLVSNWLDDVCVLLDYDSSSGDPQWRITSGCSTDEGDVHHYSALKSQRADATEGAPQAMSVWLPLSVRVCQEFRPPRCRGASEAQSSDCQSAAPSFSYLRRLVLEEHEKKFGVLVEDQFLSEDWRAAQYEGLPPPEPMTWMAMLASMTGIMLMVVSLVLGLAHLK